MIRFIAAAVVALTFCPDLLHAVDLRDATNRQLLNELAYRLRIADDRPGESATASYTCDNYANLYISILTPEGDEWSESIRIGDFSYCRHQKNQLDTTRYTFESTKIIGICNNYANLERFSVTREGTVRELSMVRIGDWRACLDQAEALNNR